MLRAILGILSLPVAVLAGGATLTIPSADGPLTIDGAVNEQIWQRAAVLPVQPSNSEHHFPGAGEVRVVLRGDYLCFSANVPELGRVVARSTGRNPAWWREDLIAFTVLFKAFSNTVTVTINPLGAYSADYGYRQAPKRPPDNSPPVLAAASLGRDGWSAEAAIPLVNIGPIGFLSAERIRAPRPDAPELRWHWPAINDRVAFRFAPGPADVPAPQFVSRLVSAARSLPPRLRIRRMLLPNWPPCRATSGPTPSARRRGRPDVGQEPALARDAGGGGRAKRLGEGRRRGGLGEIPRPPAGRPASSLGPFPDRTPLRAAVTRRLDYGDGFVIENVLFESRPGLVVTANLYLPSKMTGRVPAIVVVHSHHSPKVQSELQDFGMTWARSGTAVLIMDQLGAGERIQSQPWLRESYYSRYALGMQLYVAGESLMKWMVWDVMRGIDLLLERPYIDPQRIVMLGAVAGGGDPAAVTAALDSASPLSCRSISAKPARRNTIWKGRGLTTSKPPTRAGAIGNRHAACDAASRTSSSPGSSAPRSRRAVSCIRSNWNGRPAWKRNPPGHGTRRCSNSTANATTWTR